MLFTGNKPSIPMSRSIATFKMPTYNNKNTARYIIMTLTRNLDSSQSNVNNNQSNITNKKVYVY